MQRVGAAAALAAELLLDLLERVGVEQVAQLVGARRARAGGRGRASSAATRRSAAGASSSYRYCATYSKLSEAANGDARLRLDRDELAAAVAQAGEQLAQGTEVEVVGEQLAVGLEQDRERAVALRHGEQRLRPQPLLPQRRALAGAAARDAAARARRSRGSARRTATSRRARRRRGPRRGPGRSRPARRAAATSASGRCRMMPSSDHSACVSMPCCSRSSARSARPQGACTRAPNGDSTHRRQSPISSRKRSTTIVPVGRAGRRWRAPARAGSSTSVRAARSSQACRPVSRGTALSSSSAASSRCRRPTARPSSSGRPACSPFQNGTWAGWPGRGGDDHAVARDLLDAPGRGAEQEHLALARLVHHLLVELADAPAAVGQEDAVEAAVGDRAGVRDREPRAPSRAPQGARRAVPHDARPQLGELVRRVAARRACRARSRAARASARGRGRRAGRARAARRRAAPRPTPWRRSAGTARRAGCAARACARPRLRACRARPPRPRRARRGSAGRCARAMASPTEWPGAADALQPARDRAGRLDLHDEVDRAHVDAELERARWPRCRAASRP